MPSKWRRLRLQQGLPSLLFQYSWTSHGYELYMTDLTYIWSEQLCHKEILKRAEEDEVTIDPSEDPEQFRVLLEKIGEALRGDGVTTALHSGNDTDSFELRSTTKLPAPLKPLTWTLYLSKEPPPSLTDHLLLPVLREEADWESRQQFLLDQLKQKDWVLSKLFDKIETLGVDLGTVFPGAAGLHTTRKSTTLSEVAKFIKGAAPFDAKAWLEETRKSSSDGSGLAANLLQEMSSPDKTHLESLEPPRDKWWDNLPARPETPAAIVLSSEQDKTDRKDEKLPHSSGKEPQPQAARHEDIESDAETTAGNEDDEFERQETPPALKPKDARAPVSSPKAKTETAKKSPSPRALPAEADEATGTESEPEPAPATVPQRRRTRSKSPADKPAPPQVQPREPPKKPRRGLGVIGSKKKQEKEQSPPSSPPTAPARPSPHAPKSSKAVEVPARELSPLPGSSPTASPTKKPTKLGMIGGRAKTKPSKRTEPTTPAPEPALSSFPESASPVKPTKAWQDAPNISETTGPAKLEANEVLSRPAAAPEQPGAVVSPPAPETEERANRKREELKRQLEAKSMAPAKKKRRF